MLPTSDSFFTFFSGGSSDFGIKLSVKLVELSDFSIFRFTALVSVFKLEVLPFNDSNEGDELFSWLFFSFALFLPFFFFVNGLLGDSPSSSLHFASSNIVYQGKSSGDQIVLLVFRNFPKFCMLYVFHCFLFAPM